MRNHLDKSSVAQCLDGIRLTGRLQIPVTCHLRRRPSKRKSDRDASNTPGEFGPQPSSSLPSTAELAALTAFAHDPSLQVFEASTVKDFGRERKAPRHALIHFQGDDPEDGPILRYTAPPERHDASKPRIAIDPCRLNLVRRHSCVARLGSLETHL
jgi:hypothetical protein